MINDNMDNNEIITRLNLLQAHAELIIEEIKKIKSELPPATANNNEIVKDQEKADFEAKVRAKYFRYK